MPLWTTILKQAPALIAAADALLARSRANAAAPPGVPDDLQAIRREIATLEGQQQAQADVVRQLAEQMAALTTAAQASAERTRLAILLGGAGIALAVLATVLAAVR